MTKIVGAISTPAVQTLTGALAVDIVPRIVTIVLYKDPYSRSIGIKLEAKTHVIHQCAISCHAVNFEEEKEEKVFGTCGACWSSFRGEALSGLPHTPAAGGSGRRKCVGIGHTYTISKEFGKCLGDYLCHTVTPIVNGQLRPSHTAITTTGLVQIHRCGGVQKRNKKGIGALQLVDYRIYDCRCKS